MKEIVARLRQDIGYDQLKMRIGIHTGDIIGGVIGTEIVRFDIYGVNVLIANKIESNGATDRINVSDVTKELLENSEYTQYSFEYNNCITINACKKIILMYYLTETKTNDGEDLRGKKLNMSAKN